jgi:hypothetical protein
MTIDQSRPSAVIRQTSARGYLASGGTLVGGVVAYLVVLFVMIDTQNVNLFPALLLVGAITVPMSVLMLAYQAGPPDRVPTWAVVFTAIVGGVFGVMTASLLEYDSLRSLGSLPMVLVGVIEETAKLVVPVILYLLWRPRDPRGGIIVGIASGMGFATLETMGYGFQALLAGGLANVDSTLLLCPVLTRLPYRLDRHDGRHAVADPDLDSPRSSAPCLLPYLRCRRHLAHPVGQLDSPGDTYRHRRGRPDRARRLRTRSPPRAALLKTVSGVDIPRQMIPIMSRAAPAKAKTRRTTAVATFTTMAAATTLGRVGRTVDMRTPEATVLGRPNHSIS